MFTFESIISLFITFGKIVLCFPIFVNKAYALPYKLIPVALKMITYFTSVFSTAVYGDILFSDLSARTNSKLSESIERCLDWIPAFSSDFIIRLGSIILCKDQFELIQYLRSHPTTLPQIVKERFFFFMATAVFIMPLFFYGIRVLVPALELAEPLMQDIDGLILPRHHVTVRICILMSDISICTSHYYAILFIFICGLSLNVKLREQMERFRIAVENPTEPSEETTIDDLILESQLLHKYFENYGSIAGTYCFALIAYFTCYLIKAGSNLITDGARDAGTWVVKAETWAHWVLVAILLGILQFGSFISTSGNTYTGYSVILRMPIRTNHSVNAHEVVGITSWKWKLSALTMFDVNRRLIPGVVATVMSYFIFMFQLKTAETTSPSSSLEP